ncbi:hypothetical protein JOD63_000212 [Microbacterium terrae]|uniref:Uncharacterized protein n=1 Tax=Microbacterium terrae TaxID=69369 RepID=A0A0M2GUS2_9MICO|nr:hypothetical protein [Microbacterium terrae]KJL37416.1 hypothetical protein RS81_03170 [Microbacterium terrae]MBP1076244.1 hypothetical protein [Microbacterium terrae]GLJ97067.1 hypothetical protein GCM10017594_02640 [Microbacterium terrae]
MSAISTALGPSSVDTGSAARRPHGVMFWIARYLPAEIVGTAAMVVGGLLAGMATDSPALIAAAALLGEIVGFYAVLAITVYAEQMQTGERRRGALARTGMLLVAEFGAAELLDTLLIRPAALIAGVWLLPDPLWGLLAGKLVADVIFYAIAAGAFTVTDRTGLRRRRVARAEHPAPEQVTS